MPKINMFSSPISSAISMLAPSMVPRMRQPFIANFMLDVPELLGNLDVGTVHGAQDEATVHRELHVGCPRGLSPRRADVLAELAPRDDHFCQRHVVIGEENELEQPAEIGVVVHHVAHGRDELDDALGQVVAGRSLAPYDADPGHLLRTLLRGHFLELGVPVDDAEHVQNLSLVLVDALNLDIIQGVSTHLFARDLKDLLLQAELVFGLHLAPLRLKVGVLRAALQALEQGHVRDPLLRPELLREQCPETRVAEGQPPALGDPVGLVLELLGPHIVELLEDGLLDEAAVDGGHPVHSVRGNQREVGHAPRSS